jgi:hypothetical protein
VSIVRVGLAETKKFAEGYEAIFGKKQSSSGAAKEAPAAGTRKSKGKTKGATRTARKKK